MATDDIQRLVTGSASAPATFKVPGNGQIRPKAIFASFDGTGAGGAFKPALKITSDAGERVGIYPTDDVVAAGASADVSWFPRVAAAAQAATALNLPWGYCHALILGFASSTTVTQVDFNTSNPDNTGGTSGDADITFGANASGRWSLILHSTGFYAMCSGAYFSVSGAVTAGSAGWLNSQWLPGPLLGGTDLFPFTQVPGLSARVAEAAAVGIYNANGTTQPLPKAGNTGIAQNSGLAASVNVYQFACKLSGVSKPFTE